MRSLSTKLELKNVIKCNSHLHQPVCINELIGWISTFHQFCFNSLQEISGPSGNVPSLSLLCSLASGRCPGLRWFMQHVCSLLPVQELDEGVSAGWCQARAIFSVPRVKLFLAILTVPETSHRAVNLCRGWVKHTTCVLLSHLRPQKSLLGPHHQSSDSSCFLHGLGWGKVLELSIMKPHIVRKFMRSCGRKAECSSYPGPRLMEIPVWVTNSGPCSLGQAIPHSPSHSLPQTWWNTEMSGRTCYSSMCFQTPDPQNHKDIKIHS